MATPCIIAVGDRRAWRGVPCKLDGDTWARSVIVDRVVRSGGVGAAAEALVDAAPYGWQSAGGLRLDGPDEFLGGTGLTESTSPEILDRHHAVYILDPVSGRIEVLEDGRWLEPASFDDCGAVASLPAWYPQLGARAATRRRRPADITKQLQATCLALNVGWGPLVEALRRWCGSQLGDLTGCEWLYLSGSDSADHVRVLIDDCWVHAAVDAHGRSFTAADGKLRSIEIDNMELAEAMFRELGIRPALALPAIEKWLSLVFEVASNDSRAFASWYPGSRTWGISKRGFSVYAGEEPLPTGWLPTLLSWLF